MHLGLDVAPSAPTWGRSKMQMPTQREEVRKHLMELGIDPEGLITDTDKIKINHLIQQPTSTASTKVRSVIYVKIQVHY